MALPLVFDYLANPKLNVRRAGVPGFWALSKGSVAHIASYSLLFNATEAELGEAAHHTEPFKTLSLPVEIHYIPIVTDP